MTDQPFTATAQPFGLDDTDSDTDFDVRPRFEPAYTPVEGMRILRQRLHEQDGGIATVTFRGEAHEVYVEAGRRVPSLYATVVTDESHITTVVTVALVPTGKRVPQEPGEPGVGAKRLGYANRRHVYLLAIEHKPANLDGAPDDDIALAAAQNAQALLVNAARDGQVSQPSTDDGLTGADAHLDDPHAE